jgi:broad specificity phosphatase PhoE
MAVYIRHAKDRQKGSDTRIDTSLTSEGKEHAYSVGKRLFKKFGVPDEIRTSPFNRCRQTAFALAKYVEFRGGNVSVWVDPNLCRLTDQENARVRPDTAESGKILLECKSQFKRRVQSHSKHALEKYFTTGKVIWYVTHALVVKTAAKTHQMPCPGLVDPCAWIDLATTQCKW